jgi:hypothetical protein
LFIAVSFAYGGSLQGTIRDAQSLNPIVGVNVTVHVVIPDSVAFPTTTDQNGTYSITGIIPGNEVYAVVTYMDGYIMSYARIDNLGSLDLVYDIYLTPEPIIPPDGGGDSSTVPSGGGDSSAVLGTIMTPSANNGSLKPVVNAQVRFTSGNQQYDVKTNSEGKYTTNIPLGLYSVIVSANGYNKVTITGVQLKPVGATVNAILRSTTTGILTDKELSRPNRFALLDAFPNPANPSTIIAYELKEAGFVSIRVYDLAGREVAALVNGFEKPGYKSVSFHGSNLASGVYLYRLQAGNYSDTKKLILLK